MSAEARPKKPTGEWQLLARYLALALGLMYGPFILLAIAQAPLVHPERVTQFVIHIPMAPGLMLVRPLAGAVASFWQIDSSAISLLASLNTLLQLALVTWGLMRARFVGFFSAMAAVFYLLLAHQLYLAITP